MHTDAMRFVDQIRVKNIAPKRATVEAAGGVKTGRFHENIFFDMPDRSRVILSDPSCGYRLVRAAPSIEGEEAPAVISGDLTGMDAAAAAGYSGCLARMAVGAPNAIAYSFVQQMEG